MTAIPAPAATRRPMSRRSRQLLMAAPMVLLLVTFLIYPSAQLFLLSFQKGGGFSLENYQRLLGTPVYLTVMMLTLKISVVTTIFAVIAGYPVAYLISILPKAKKGRILFWILLSFWTSFLVRAFAWIILLGRNGVVNKLLQTLGISDAPIALMYNFSAVVIGMVHALLPLAVLTMLSVMENIDRNLTRAASTLGAKPGMAFWKIYFPLSFPGVTSGALMVFVTAIGFFIFPALLGGRRETMITQIIIEQIIQTMNWGFASAVAVLLLVVVLLVFVLYDRAVGLSTMTGESSARKGRPGRKGIFSRIGDAILTGLGHASNAIIGLFPRRRAREGAPRPLVGFVTVLLAVMTLPVLLMIPLSFAESGLNWPPQGFTLKWYQQIFNSPIWMSALTRSLVVGFSTAVLALLIGTPVAFLMVRGRMRGKTALLAFTLMPVVMPNMILSVGLFYLYAKIGLVGTNLGLIIGHTVIAVPYVVLTVMSVLRNYDTRLDLAAQSLGATPIRTLRLVTLPIIGAGMISAFLFAFTISFDELTIALFTSGGMSATLPKQLWDEVSLSISPLLAAVSTCLFLFVTVLIVAVGLLNRRQK
ncbi:ABC transporter permease subunit [Paracoccus sp. SSJ]|uniref:ABC transporter permease subunit n=1 Tax=Paracoccus sp. SSJ TaxID=3050636 RepID=UPI00254B6EC8|nr:ABC transporter permease subunit [Paracoccus sp. SSJ]MDK8871272.1 ABC transporter permease subunit [Paracoccus sp. SSJ]